MSARGLFRRAGGTAAILGLAGAALCLMLRAGGAAADVLPQLLAGSAILGGAGAFAFLAATGRTGGDPAPVDGGSGVGSDSGGGDGGDAGGDGGGGDGGGE